MAALEAEIEGCELELTSLGSQINDASARGDLEAVSALGSRHQELESRLKKLIERWSDLQA
jgi:hypothetical protein